MPHQDARGLDGKLVVVIGGTSGLGYAIAQAVLDRNADVVVASSNSASVDAALRRLSAQFTREADIARARGFTRDLTATDLEERIVGFFDFASNNSRRKIDRVAVTAGEALFPKPLVEVHVGDLVKVAQVRLTGSMLLAKHATKSMNNSASSSFTLTSGIRDVRPAAGFAPIAPISAALKCLAKCLAHDMAPVRVNSISPGAVRTEIFTKIAGEHADAALHSLAQQTLTKSNGVPEGIVDIYITVMTSTYIDGLDIVADGGSLIF